MRTSSNIAEKKIIFGFSYHGGVFKKKKIISNTRKQRIKNVDTTQNILFKSTRNTFQICLDLERKKSKKTITEGSAVYRKITKENVYADKKHMSIVKPMILD